MPNNAYSLWRVNAYQQGFYSLASFGYGGQESASKPPQAIFKPLGLIAKKTKNIINMKNTLLILTLLITVNLYSNGIDTLRINSKIKDVTVFLMVHKLLE